MPPLAAIRQANYLTGQAKKHMIKTDILQNLFFSARPQISAARRNFGVEQQRPWMLYAIIAVNAALLLSYLLGVNARASTGYEIKELQKQAQKLNETQKALNLKMSEATAISVLTDDFSKSGFVQAGAPIFVTLQAPATALK
jgi:hypothetical protein